MKPQTGPANAPTSAARNVVALDRVGPNGPPAGLLGESAPLVTIIALCFNTGRYAVQALECVREQSYQNVQLILVDDGSTDGSERMLEDWLAQTRFPGTLVKKPENRGIPAAFNTALSMARGEFVTWIADDLWERQRIQAVVSAFQCLPPSVGVLFGDALIVDSEGRVTGSLSPSRILEVVGHPGAAQLAIEPGACAIVARDFVREALFWRCFLPAPSVTVRRRVYNVIGPYRTDVLIEDLDCWFRVADHFDFAYLRQPLVRYRVHATNFSSGVSDAYLASLARILNLHRQRATMRATLRAARRHIREEAYRVVLRLAQLGLRKRATRAFIRYYLPNLQPSLAALKETAKVLGALTATGGVHER